MITGDTAVVGHIRIHKRRDAYVGHHGNGVTAVTIRAAITTDILQTQ